MTNLKRYNFPVVLKERCEDGDWVLFDDIQQLDTQMVRLLSVLGIGTPEEGIQEVERLNNRLTSSEAEVFRLREEIGKHDTS